MNRILEKIRKQRGWAYRDKWKFCGSKHPWITITGSNRIALVTNVENAVSIPVMTVHYQIYEVKLQEYFQELSNVRERHVPRVNTILFQLKPSALISTRRFHVIGKPGEVLYFVNSTCRLCRADCIAYDGFDLYHKLFEVHLEAQDTVDLHHFSRYFRAYIILHFKDMDLSVQQKWLLGITRRLIDMINITEAYQVQLDNRGLNQIVNYVLFVNFTDGKFPRLSIRSQVSNGFNEKDCAYGGVIIAQSVNGSMLTNDTYGPYCSRLLVFQPFLSESDFSELVFSSDPFMLIVYAFGPLYELKVDINVTTTVCEGIINPLTLCMRNDTNSQIPQGVNIVKSNYRYSCHGISTSEHYGGMYFKILMTNLQVCIVIQQIPSALSDLNYIIRLKMFSDTTIWISTPAFTEVTMQRTHWGQVSIHASSTDIIRSTANGPITYQDTPATTIQYLTRFAFHKLMYSVQLTHKKVIQRCASYNESSHAVWETVFTRPRHFLALNSACGIGRYIKNYIYIFAFSNIYTRVRFLSGKFIEYVSVTTTLKFGCNSTNQTNTITITIVRMYTNTIQISEREFNLTLYSMLWALIIEKNDPCSVIVVKFSCTYIDSLPTTKQHIEVCVIVTQTVLV